MHREATWRTEAKSVLFHRRGVTRKMADEEKFEDRKVASIKRISTRGVGREWRVKRQSRRRERNATSPRQKSDVVINHVQSTQNVSMGSRLQLRIDILLSQHVLGN